MCLHVCLSLSTINFLRSWKVSHTTGIPCNSQGQTTVERINRALKELLTRTISPEARRDPHLSLTEVTFHMNFLSFDDEGLNTAYRHWVSLPRTTPLPL